MVMPKAPKASPLVLCNRYHVDPLAAEQSLVGVFHAFWGHAFPYRAVEFTVYAALIGGSGDGRMVLTVMRLETEEVVYKHTKWYACLSDNLVATYEQVVKQCVFPAPGRYSFSLAFEGQDVASRIVDVLRR
jgi:hypothetical protein